MKITHIKLMSREEENASFKYFYLARIKLNFLWSSHYICILTSAKSELNEEQLKVNMSTLDVLTLMSSEQQSPAQRMWLRSDLHDTELGRLSVKKFERTNYLIFGKEKYWDDLPCEYK